MKQLCSSLFSPCLNTESVLSEMYFDIFSRFFFFKGGVLIGAFKNSECKFTGKGLLIPSCTKKKKNVDAVQLNVSDAISKHVCSANLVFANLNTQKDWLIAALWFVILLGLVVLEYDVYHYRGYQSFAWTK